MVAEKRDPATFDCEFEIRPNCSLSWRGMVAFFLIMLLLTAIIAARFAVLGAWMILPFAGLEMLVLATSLYLCAHRASRREVISIRDEVVQVLKGRRRPEHSFEFTRGWVRVNLRPGARRLHRSRLTIGTHGREVEIGDCLVEEERERLAAQLRQALTREPATRQLA